MHKNSNKQANLSNPKTQENEIAISLKLYEILNDLTVKNVGSKTPKFFTKNSLQLWLEKNHEIPAAIFNLNVNAKKIDEFLKTNFYTLAAAAKISAQLENYKNENWPEKIQEPIDVNWDITYPKQFKKGFGINNHSNPKFDQIENSTDQIISLFEEEEVLDY